MRGAILGALLLFGCGAHKGLYRWGGYDEGLYAHYRNPQEAAAWAETMAGIIAYSESYGGPVPPGCYAEYGWALYEQGRREEATVYFEKESKSWPESRGLMEKLIRNARRGAAAQAGPRRDT